MTSEEREKYREEQVRQIKDRFFRKVIAYPEGAIVHHGDCWWYACQICNCGLHSDLVWMSDDRMRDRLYPRFWEEHGVSLRRRDQIQGLPLEEQKPPTPEEQAACDRMIEEMFGKGCMSWKPSPEHEIAEHAECDRILEKVFGSGYDKMFVPSSNPDQLDERFGKKVYDADDDKK